MYICILAPDDKVEAVRAKAKENIPFFAKAKVLTTPCSPTGEAPATHWLCNFNCKQEMYEKIVSLKEFSEVIEGRADDVLWAKGLKIIRLMS